VRFLHGTATRFFVRACRKELRRDVDVTANSSLQKSAVIEFDVIAGKRRPVAYATSPICEEKVMLNRRQMVSRLAGGVFIGGALGSQAHALPERSIDRTGWLPQLSESAETLVEAEAQSDRFESGWIHYLDFMPGVTLLVGKTKLADGVGRLGRVQSILRRHGKEMSKPGVTEDGKAWVLFVCADASDVAKRLGSRAGRIRLHRPKV